ncbi:MAG TPA: aminotransferase class I/II-fold pyridoxal phosphate-dependent enzyme [Spirochaetes bacterium]|nr:aminotransferase class I/II-fold pyridoxal phosphate-dependent enzyme [Spirochaetota bacterium]
MNVFDKCFKEGGYLGMFRAAKDKYYTRPILSLYPGTEMEFNGIKTIIWSLNNYLGLAENDEIKKIASEAAAEYGASAPMGSRMLTGNTVLHEKLEQKLAAFEEKESAILFNYGYLGVLGTLSAIVHRSDTIIIDKLSHACMIDGTFLAGGKYRFYKHNDMNDLEKQLKTANKLGKGGTLIVTEGVFGMRGDLANLPALCDLKDQYGARLFVDDAHGCGVMGPNGKGTPEHFGLMDRVDLYFSTFAKSFAAIGGFTTGDTEVIRYIRYNARTQIFAKSLPMIYVKAVDATMDIIQKNPGFRTRLWEVAKKLQNGLREAGFHLGDIASPITPVYVPGEPEVAMTIIKYLREQKGIFVSGVMYPVVPKGIILLRMIPTAAHTDEQIEKTLSAFRDLRDDFKLHLEKIKL